LKIVRRVSRLTKKRGQDKGERRKDRTGIYREGIEKMAEGTLFIEGKESLKT